jgi:hypothetical protein
VAVAQHAERKSAWPAKAVLAVISFKSLRLSWFRDPMKPSKFTDKWADHR